MDGIGGINTPYAGLDGSSGPIIWLETSRLNSAGNSIVNVLDAQYFSVESDGRTTVYKYEE